MKNTTSLEAFEHILSELDGFQSTTIKEGRELQTAFKVSLVSTKEGVLKKEFAPHDSAGDQFNRLEYLKGTLLRDDVVGGKIEWGNGFLKEKSHQTTFYIADHIRPEEHKKMFIRNADRMNDESFIKLLSNPYLMLELLIEQSGGSYAK
jgi:hypothetical protein